MAGKKVMSQNIRELEDQQLAGTSLDRGEDLACKHHINISHTLL